MSHRTTRLALPVLAALAAVTVLAQGGAAQTTGAPTQPVAHQTAPAVDRAAEEQAIRALSQRWLAAQQKKDLDGVMAQFAPTAVAVYGGRLMSGIDAIRQGHVDDFARYAKERPDHVPSWQTTAVELSESGDLAYESGTTDDRWNAGKNREQGHYLTIWRKIDGQWKVVHDIATPAAAPAAAPTSVKKPAP
ncbi:MAG: YybH family protein [Gemmatirosa sp.]